MGLPSKKRTKQQKRERRSHIKLTSRALIKCENCGAFRMPHRACPSCGFYGGRDVLGLKVKEERKKIRAKKREKKSSS